MCQLRPYTSTLQAILEKAQLCFAKYDLEGTGEVSAWEAKACTTFIRHHALAQVLSQKSEQRATTLLATLAENLLPHYCCCCCCCSQKALKEMGHTIPDEMLFDMLRFGDEERAVRSVIVAVVFPFVYS